MLADVRAEFSCQYNYLLRQLSERKPSRHASQFQHSINTFAVFVLYVHSQVNFLSSVLFSLAVECI